MSMVDIPVIATVTEDDEITECKILAGAAIINVAAGARTAQVVASIRAHHPEIPILASGGGREDRILATIDAGADAITWTTNIKSLRWRRVFHRRLLATAKPLVS